MRHRWHELVDGGRQTWADLVRGWRPLVLFELLFKVFSIAMVRAALAWFLRSVIRFSGSTAVSNYDLISFFLSPQGLLLLVVGLAVSFAVLFLELGGLMMIVIGIRQRQRVSAIRTLQTLGRAFARLVVLGCWYLIGLGIPAVVLLGVVAVVGNLAFGGDVNYYLQVKPPEFWWAASIVALTAVGAGCTAAVLLIRWVFSVPIMMLQHHTPRRAMVESTRLVQGAKVEIAARFLVWFVQVVILVVLAGLFRSAIEGLLMHLAGNQVQLVIVMAGLILAVELLLSVVVSFVTSVSFASLSARLYLERCPDAEVPPAMLHDTRVGRRRVTVGAGVVTAALAVLGASSFAAWSLVSQIKFNHDVAVTAHRGSELKAPENTLEAVLQAVADGADFAEIDVQQTADGVVVLMHDKDFRRVAAVDRPIWEMSSAELATLDIGSWFAPEFAAVRVATLAEVIEAARGKIMLNIELKFNGHEQNLVESVIDLIRNAKFEQECIVTSLEYRGILETRRQADSLRVGLIVTAKIGEVTQLDVDLLSVNANSVSRDLVARAHAAGKQVHVWTVNEPEQMLAMIHMGVDNIITSRPDVLRDLLRQREQMSAPEKTLLFVADFLEGRI